MKSTSTIRPHAIEPVGNGSYLYHFDIVETPAIGEGDPSAAQYEYQEVVVWPPITANSVLQAVIADKWPASHEQKLVNDYNAALLGFYPADVAEAKTEAYRSFLSARAAMKAQVEQDIQPE